MLKVRSVHFPVAVTITRSHVAKGLPMISLQNTREKKFLD
jgi:hypothetical protein